MTPLDVIRGILFLPRGASTAADGIDTLHAVVLGSALVGSIAVAAVTAKHVLNHRRQRDDEPTPHIESSRLVTTLKIGGPLALFLAFWVVGFRQYIAIETPPPDAIDVYVTGKQWMWKFAYPSGQSSISTLVVPRGRAVRLIMTSRDVIHSFYVPSFRVKQDVIPGRTTTMWFEPRELGTYEILCAEYCGSSHSGMGGAVRVVEPDEFARWLADQGTTMATRGAEIAREKQCLACHSADGEKRVGPSFAGLFRASIPLADGRTVVADEGYLSRSIMLPGADVHAGYPATMPAYEGQLGVDEVAALVEYIKSLSKRGTP